MIDRYLTTRYRDGGRGPDEFDCYGLVRSARVELFDLPLLPCHGAVSPQDKRSMTRITRQTSAGMQRCPAQPGAIATCWNGKLCLHVGIVVGLDGRLGVLETASCRGPGWRALRHFEQDYQRVEYYT